MNNPRQNEAARTMFDAIVIVLCVVAIAAFAQFCGRTARAQHSSTLQVTL